MTDDRTPPWGQFPPHDAGPPSPPYGTRPWETPPGGTPRGQQGYGEQAYGEQAWDPEASAGPLPGYEGTPYPGHYDPQTQVYDAAPPPPPRRSNARRWILLAVAAVALVAVGAGVFLLLHRSAATAPAPRTATAVAAPPPAVPTAAPTAAPVTAPVTAPGPLTLTATADCTAPDSVDAAGATVAYQAANLVDGRPDTAWRCDGNGAGHTIKLTLSGPATVTQIGIVPGYAKTDATDGTDRYAQNRRLSKVRYVFDDGSAVEQTLDTASGNRALQTVAVPNVRTSSVTVQLLASVAGQKVGKSAASDRVAISEVQVVGTAA